MVDDQLHETDGSCATIGSKVMTRAVNKLKMRSKTDEVASVALKINKTGSCATIGSKVMTRAVNKLKLRSKTDDGSCATIGSKVMTRAVNKLKLRSKTDEVASVGLKVNKACL